MKNSTFLVTFMLFASFFLVSCGSSSNENKQNAQTAVTPEPEPAPVVNEETLPPTSEANLGEKLFKDKGCVVCHQLNSKLVGPSLVDVSLLYKDDKESLTSFLLGKKKPIVDPGQADVMKPQIEITKAMAASDLEAVVDYILSAHK